MKQIKSNTDLNQRWQPIPETTQQLIRGGTLDEIQTTDTAEGYIRIKKLNSGG